MKTNINYIKLLLVILVTSFSCSEEHISITGKGTLTGKVVSVGTNEPIENAKVSTSPSSSIVFTNETGDFIIQDINVGEYSVQAEKEGLLPEFEGITISEEVTTNVIFEMDIETANNNAPNAPVLILPLNNATNLEVSLDLTWSGSDPEDDDLTYTVEILNDQNTDVLTFENIADTTLSVSGLLYGTKYFWQVFASDNINNPVSSNVFNFETLEFPENRILFTRKINGNNVIFSSDEVGNELQLTSENNNSWRPRKASTINRIAYLRTDGGQTHIYTMNFDGSNRVKVTNAVPVSGFNFEDLDFEWKSNDSKLIYPSFDKLYEISSNGDALQLLYQTTNGNFISEVDWNENTSQIALKTNNNQGYNVEIFTINTSGIVQDIVLQGVLGAAGGIDFSFDGTKILYTYDTSGTENLQYRQLSSEMFVYNFITSVVTSISIERPPGTNDLDAKFDPTEAKVIFVNTPNDGVSQNDVYSLIIGETNSRVLVVSNAKMPDWK